MKRILSLVLSVLLILSCMTAGAFAETTYTDTDGHWAKAYIDFAAEKGFMSGCDAEDTFCPQQGMTRAMLVSSLHDIAADIAELQAQRSAEDMTEQTDDQKQPSAGSDADTPEKEDIIYGVEGTEGLLFSDMTGDEPYAADVKWAVENGIINGINGAFCPDLTVDRQTVAVMLYRFSGATGISLQEDWTYIMEYNDIELIDIWAVDGIAYCGMTGLMTGDTEGNFCPKDPLTRAQAAAVLYRLYERIEMI